MHVERRRSTGTYGRGWRDLEQPGWGWKCLAIASLLLLALACFLQAGMFDGWLK